MSEFLFNKNTSTACNAIKKDKRQLNDAFCEI